MDFSKVNLLELYAIKQKELGKRQREYKKVLSTKLATRKETILEASYHHTIDSLQMEKNKLRAQIWVAGGVTHVQENHRYLQNIQCHVECQEHLADDIHKLKTAIANMERENSRVNKQVYDLNRKTIPDSQHISYVAKVRKRLLILENQLEVGVRRECGFTSANAALREELIKVLHHRTFFHEAYSKLVQRLNSDRKYLVDLIEYALNTFESGIEVYEKVDNIVKKEAKERDLCKMEMQAIQRTIQADADNALFLETTRKQRKLDDLQPKEYARREKFRKKHNHKISLYNDILNKILLYTKSQNVEAVIEKYEQDKNLYYSYFNYANEMSYHMTLLNNSVNHLYMDIENLKKYNRNTLQEQIENIANLEAELKDKQSRNSELLQAKKVNDDRLENLLQGIESIFEMSHGDASPLMLLLGDHTAVNLVNMRQYLKLLERHLYNINATVYIMERKDENKSYDKVVVQLIDKVCEYPTNLADIVLTQQCPECAEGDAFNVDDATDGGVAINTISEAKKKLYEKVNQPEMQYRLHNISQCRLPRSRILAAKRNI